PWVDPVALRAAVNRVRNVPDHRTAMLLAEASAALRDYEKRISDPPPDARFPYLWAWLMEPTDPKAVKQLLRELGRELVEAQSLEIGGSIALLWSGLLSRHTQGLDFVDEVPPSVRQAARSRQIEQRYGLKLASFQSHYLPDGWRARLRDQGTFGKLHV